MPHFRPEGSNLWGRLITATLDPTMFSAALNYILFQLHLRYTLGFKPLIIDGERHTLKVELTKERTTEFQGIQLRVREQYGQPHEVR